MAEVTAEELERLKEAVALRARNVELSERQNKLLRDHNILSQADVSHYKDLEKSLQRQEELLKERTGSEREFGEILAINNKIRENEVDIYNAKIRAAEKFLNTYEAKQTEVLEEQEEIQKRIVGLQAQIRSSVTSLNKARKAGNKKEEDARKEKIKDLQRALAEEKQQKKINKVKKAALKDEHDAIKAKNKDEEEGEERSLENLFKGRKARKDLSEADEGMQSGLRSILKTFTGLSDKGLGFFKSMLDFKNLMEDADDDMTGWQQVMSKVKDIFEALGGELAAVGAAVAAIALSTLKWMKDFDKAASDFRKNTGIIDKGLMGVEQSIVNVQRANIRMGVSTEEAFAAQSALTGEMAAFTSMTDDAQQKVLQVTAVMGEFGVSAQTTAQIFNKFSKGLGYDADQLEKLSTQLMAISESLKIPPQIIAEDFNQASTELMKYGDDMIDVFKGLEEQSKQTGIGMQELLGIAKQFDTFEDAGNAVGRLNAILGGPYLNAIQMVYATEEERIKAMRESIQMSGQQFKDMNRFEQQAIASAAGIDDMSLAARLFGGTQSEFAETTMTMQEMQERAVKAQAVWDKFGQIFDTIAIALAPLVDVLGFLADVLLIMLNPLGEVARLFTDDADWIAGIGTTTTAVVGLVGAMQLLGITTKLTFAAIAKPLLAFGAAFAVVSKALDWLRDFAGSGASVIIGALLGIAGAIAVIWIAATAGSFAAAIIPAMIAAGVAMAGIGAAMKGFEQGSGGAVVAQDALTHAGESKEDRFGNVTPITQTGVDHLEGGTTVHTAEATESRRLGAPGKSGPGITREQGQQIIALLTALGTDPETAAAGGGDTVINLVMDPAGTKVIAKGLIKQGDVRKDTTEKLKTKSALTITKAGG